MTRLAKLYLFWEIERHESCCDREFEGKTLTTNYPERSCGWKAQGFFLVKMDEETSGELHKAYQDKSHTNHIILQQQLCMFRIKPKTTEHSDSLKTMVMNHKAVKIDIKDESQAMILSCSLAKESTTFIDSMIYGWSKIYLIDVKTYLHNKVLRYRLINETVDCDSNSVVFFFFFFFCGGNKMMVKSTELERDICINLDLGILGGVHDSIVRMRTLIVCISRS